MPATAAYRTEVNEPGEIEIEIGADEDVVVSELATACVIRPKGRRKKRGRHTLRETAPAERRL
jgi:hypothetical protein